jgi:hypothetical protein
MTPKHKAEELFDKMSTNNGDEYHHCTYYVAKQCALIAVEEIMSALTYLPYGLDYLNKITYWQEVKQEIEAL